VHPVLARQEGLLSPTISDAVETASEYSSLSLVRADDLADRPASMTSQCLLWKRRNHRRSAIVTDAVATEIHCRMLLPLSAGPPENTPFGGLLPRYFWLYALSGPACHET